MKWRALLEHLTPRRSLVVDGLFLLAILYLIAQSIFQSRQIGQLALVAESPILYQQFWRPEQQAYHPAGVVRFQVYREVKGEDPVAIYSLDSWHNIDTGETYPGAPLGDVLTPDAGIRTEVRRLPSNMRDGRYVLRGYVLAQMKVRVAAQTYQSEPFAVSQKNTASRTAKP